MVNNELTLSLRVDELEKQVAELRGQATQQNQDIRNSNRLTIWQFISFAFVMAGTLFGTLAWISSSLREELRTNREVLEKRIEQSEKSMQKQLELTEKNMTARFEDLRQVVLSQQKQSSKK